MKLDEPNNPNPAPDGSDHPCCGGPSTRRQFMFYFGLMLNAVAGALLAIPLVGYALSSFRKDEPQDWINLGPVGQFPKGQTRLATYENPTFVPWDGATKDIPCWVRHMDDGKGGSAFQVFAINCTHLGCPVRWFQESRLFMCPCHGGVFYENGDHASGPPPRELYQYKYKLENGNLLVWGGQIPTLANPV